MTIVIYHYYYFSFIIDNIITKTFLLISRCNVTHNNSRTFEDVQDCFFNIVGVLNLFINFIPFQMILIRVFFLFLVDKKDKFDLLEFVCSSGVPGNTLRTSEYELEKQGDTTTDGACPCSLVADVLCSRLRWTRL